MWMPALKLAWFCIRDKHKATGLINQIFLQLQANLSNQQIPLAPRAWMEVSHSALCQGLCGRCPDNTLPASLFWVASDTHASLGLSKGMIDASHTPIAQHTGPMPSPPSMTSLCAASGIALFCLVARNSQSTNMAHSSVCSGIVLSELRTQNPLFGSMYII